MKDAPLLVDREVPVGSLSKKVTNAKFGSAAVLVAAFALTNFYGWVLNASIYSEVASYAGVLRETSTFLYGFVLLTIGLIAQFRPRWLDKRILLVIAVFCSITALPILLLAIPQKDIVFSGIGFMLLNIGHAWAYAVVALAACQLWSLRASVITVALGYALGEICTILVPVPSLELGIAICCLIAFAILVLLYRMSSKSLDLISAGTSAAHLQHSNPESFLKPLNKFYLCAAFFGFAFGYCLTLNEVDSTPVSHSFFALLLVVVALWIIFSKGEEKADTLFSICVLLVIAGFLSAPFTFFTNLTFANGFLRVGTKTFEILIWIVFIAIGRRNLFALLPMVGVVECLNMVGLSLGAVIGHTSNDLLSSNQQLVASIAAVAAFLFIAFLWFVFRNFSFDATIRGVVTYDSLNGEQSVDDIERRCEEIGSKKDLTSRQIEIFTMLARGRNSRFIREYYVLSNNTVKSHIRHIYQKLNIHSQQELIDLVEAHKEEPHGRPCA